MKKSINISVLSLFQLALILICFGIKQNSFSQLIASQKFGKNRLQFDRFDWHTLESEKFTFFFNDSANGSYAIEVANMVLEEQNNLQVAFDFDIPIHFNVLFYYSFEHYLQSNAGIHLDLYRDTKIATLVNEKIIIYYSSDTEKLRTQIRQALSRLILEILINGFVKGESDQLDFVDGMPNWFFYGLIAYKSQTWNTDWDYKLKIIVQDNKYKKFNHFIVDDPFFAGLTFWYFVELKYGPATINNIINYLKFNKDLNTIFQTLLGYSYDGVLELIFPLFETIYNEDNKNRQNFIQGSMLTSTHFIKQDVVTIQANPVLKKGIYGIVEFKEGIYYVYVSESKVKKRLILKSGVRMYRSYSNHNYPLIAWSQNGINLGVVYYDKSFLHFFEYDVVSKTKNREINLSEHFVSIQDFKYIKNSDKLLLSAVKNGQSDIFIFDLQTNKIENVTDDIYDDIDPSYVSFPGKSGIIFSSNRPFDNSIYEQTKQISSIIRNEKFKIFLADYMLEDNYHQITPLAKSIYGNLRYPAQFTTSYYSYLSDENGIMNRYIGTFFSKKLKLDTVYYVDKKPFFNLNEMEIDSFNRKNKIQKITYYLKTYDTSSVFPITNYSRGIVESRSVSGPNPILTDLRYSSNAKILYKVTDNKINDTSLSKKLLPVTGFIKYKYFNYDPNKIKKSKGKLDLNSVYQDSAFYFKNYFFSELDFNPLFNMDTLTQSEDNKPSEPMNKKISSFLINSFSKKYVNKFFILSADMNVLNNELMGDKYQPYNNGMGPIQINSQSIFNSTFKISVSDILEDLNLTLSYRFPLSIYNTSTSFLLDCNYLKYITDFGFTYYRNVNALSSLEYTISNNYLFKLSYPFSVLDRLNFAIGFRRDRYSFKYFAGNTSASADFLKKSDSIIWNAILRLEYTNDNSIQPAYNILKGLRYKVYLEYFTNLTKEIINEHKINDKLTLNKNTINLGFDVRLYKPIYKNIVWATRFSADFSFGNRRVLYYLGGTDGWVNPKFNEANTPKKDVDYAYQSLAINLRGYKQNVANGTNNFVTNTEIRVPILSSILPNPISNSFLRNLQVVFFWDLGTAWNGGISNIKPAKVTYTKYNVSLDIIGKYSVASGYGVGFRALLYSYFLKLDFAYPLPYFFTNRMLHFSMCLDF